VNISLEFGRGSKLH